VSLGQRSKLLGTDCGDLSKSDLTLSCSHTVELPAYCQSATLLPHLAENMPSQNSTQAANVTTAADEISRFARYVEFRTRDLRASVANYIARTDTTIPARTFREREEMYEEDIFVDIEAPDEEGWVGVTDEVKELHAVSFHFLSTAPERRHLQCRT
jgi:hypothetical protein